MYSLNKFFFDNCTLQKVHLVSSSIRAKKWDGSDEQKMELLTGEKNAENEQNNEEEETAF